MNQFTIMACDIIKIEKNNQIKNGVDWSNSEYKEINELHPNNVGNFGEKYIKNICLLCDIECDIDGSKTKKIGGSYIGDGKIKGNSVEVKTARLGNNNTFQHELGEHPWHSDYILFVDITPNNIYISIFKNFTKEHYNTVHRSAKPYFDKMITRRKEKSEENSGNFKLTLNENDLKFSKYTFIINNNTTKESLKNFINTSINN